MSETFGFASTRHKKSNSIRCSNRLRSMLFHQMRNTAASEQRNQRLDDLMLFDPHVKYAKSIGVEDTKIRYSLLNQIEKNYCNFFNRQELLNAILD